MSAPYGDDSPLFDFEVDPDAIPRVGDPAIVSTIFGFERGRVVSVDRDLDGHPIATVRCEPSGDTITTSVARVRRRPAEPDIPVRNGQA